MTGTILLIILAASIGMYHDTNKPTEYELSMEDGSNKHVVLQKNSQYACPLHCEVDHIHHELVIADLKMTESAKTCAGVHDEAEQNPSFGVGDILHFQICAVHAVDGFEEFLHSWELIGPIMIVDHARGAGGHK